MRFARIAAAIAVPVMSTVLLAGCGSTFRVATPYGTATCHPSQGSCAMNGQTASVEPGSGHKHTATPVTTATPTVPAASPLPGSTVPAVQAAVAAIANCMSQFSTDTQDTLVSFSTSADARQNMAVCLQMPPQTVAQFLKLLFRYSYAAYVKGDFSNPSWRQWFTTSAQGNTLPSAVVRCDRHYREGT